MLYSIGNHNSSLFGKMGAGKILPKVDQRLYRGLPGCNTTSYGSSILSVNFAFMEIYLIRHTIPKVAKGICYGQTNLETHHSFDATAKLIRSYLPKRLDIVYSSPLVRCLKLAETLSSSVVVDKRLIEMNFGDWEMKLWDELPKDKLKQWMADFVNVRVPGGESFGALIDRVNMFLEDIAKVKHKNICIVSHSGVIRTILGNFLKMDPAYLFRIQVDYGSISLIKLNHRLPSIEFINRKLHCGKEHL